MALGLAFAAFAAPAAAQPDANGGRTVTAGGWTGTVNDAGIPLSAGIPSGDELYLSTVTVGGWTGTVDGAGIPLSAGIPSGDEPYLSVQRFESRAITAEAVKSQASTPAPAVDPYLTDVFVRPGESLSGPDGGSLAADLGAAAAVQANGSVAPAPSSDRSWAVSRDGAITLGLGALALALALGLAVGYARRPRIAGL